MLNITYMYKTLDFFSQTFTELGALGEYAESFKSLLTIYKVNFTKDIINETLKNIAQNYLLST